LLLTLMTPFAPTAIMPSVRLSSPESTVRRSPSIRESSCARRMLPVASFVATMFGAASQTRTVVSTERSTCVRPGILYSTIGALTALATVVRCWNKPSCEGFE
jgi:hypothetical protein